MTKGIHYANLKKGVNWDCDSKLSSAEYQRQCYEVPVANKVFADLNSIKVARIVEDFEAQWAEVKETDEYKAKEQRVKEEAERGRLERAKQCVPFLLMLTKRYTQNDTA